MIKALVIAAMLSLAACATYAGGEPQYPDPIYD